MIEKKRSNNLIINIFVNKKAKYEYFIQERLEAGLVLFGWEVKAFKSRNINISNSYISFRLGECYLVGSQFNTISTMQSCIPICNPQRDKKILLHKHEIIALQNKIYKKGYTVIVLSCFLKNNWCKIEIAVAKGKTQYDKRETKKKSQWKLEKSRILKRTN
ncbi:MAG: SsrA-binding protein SmpB [Buchnera aphidicola (Nurudea yanoniella)]